MTYNGDATDSNCYSAAESMIVSIDSGSDILKKLWITAYWAEAQIQLQDFIAISSGLYIDCSGDKLFNTLSTIASSEGMSTAGGRVAGALPFEIGTC